MVVQYYAWIHRVASLYLEMCQHLRLPSSPWHFSVFVFCVVLAVLGLAPALSPFQSAGFKGVAPVSAVF